MKDDDGMGTGSPPPVEVAEEAPQSDSGLWDDLLSDDDGELGTDEVVAEVAAEEVSVEAEPKAAPTPTPAEAKEPEKSIVETPVVVAPEAPRAAETKVEVVSQPVAAEAPAEATVTEEQRKYLHEQAIQALSMKYALSEEEASAFQVEPEKVLPKLAATLHASIYQDVLQRVIAEAPALIERTLSEKESSRQAEEAFYGRWGVLRNHQAEVAKVAAMWRQMYPKASLEEAIEGIGGSAMALLGLGAAQAQSSSQAPAAPPPPPAGPSSRAVAQVVPRAKLSMEEQAFVDLANTIEEEF